MLIISIWPTLPKFQQVFLVFLGLSHLMNEDDCGIASEHDLVTSTTSWARPWYAPQPFDCLKSYSKHSIHPHVLELILLHHRPLHRVRLEIPLIGQAWLLPNIEIQAMPSLVVELSISHHWLIKKYMLYDDERKIRTECKKYKHIDKIIFINHNIINNIQY